MDKNLLDLRLLETSPALKNPKAFLVPMLLTTSNDRIHLYLH